MPRNVIASFRHDAEANFSDDVNLIFLVIEHSLIDTIFLVNDTVDYMLDSEQWIGFPFDIEILTDDETPPTARLSIQNVDPKIGDAIRGLITPPKVTILLYSSDDWDLSTNPREPLGSPTLVYDSGGLFLINVSVDIMTVSGQLVGWDYQQRVWPSERATKDNFPGLFRS
jgi:hypothetical protein